MYKGPKHFMLGRSVAEAVVPTCGIPPGCSWVGTLAKVYYIGAFDAFTLRYPQVDLDVYVDDIQSSTVGSEEAITTRLTEATEDFGVMVEHQIESRLVPAKAAVVASSDRLARKLRAALGELAGTPAWNRLCGRQAAARFLALRRSRAGALST